MQTYSQKDKAYGKRIIPRSNLTMANYGCYITSIAMLAQKHPTELLQNGLFANGGYIYSSRAAKAVGLAYKGATRMPPKKGWCIGVTNKYAPKWPTHFLLVNPSEGLMVDPLKINPKVEKLTYRISQYRLFDGVKFNHEQENNTPQAVLDAIALNSEAWKELAAVQSKLNKSNNLLRSL